MIAPTVLRAMLIAGATAEMIVAALEADYEAEAAKIAAKKARDAKRQRDWRAANKSRNVTVTKCDKALVTVTKERSPIPPKENNTPLEAKASNAPKGAGTRGKRLSEDWKPSTEAEAWAVALGISAFDVAFETEAFRDHFLSAASAKAVKLDWQRTWKNWMREAKRRQRPGKVNGSHNNVHVGGVRWCDVRYDYENKYGKTEALKRFCEDHRKGLKA